MKGKTRRVEGDIRDKAIAISAYARQAKNRDFEADAIVRLRATRRLDPLRQAQKEKGGISEAWSKGSRVVRKPELMRRPSLRRASTKT
jgi:hypothetical protein